MELQRERYIYIYIVLGGTPWIHTLRWHILGNIFCSGLFWGYPLDTHTKMAHYGATLRLGGDTVVIKDVDMPSYGSKLKCHLRVNPYMYMYVHIDIYIYVKIITYIHIYICIFVYTCAFILMHFYTHSCVYMLCYVMLRYVMAWYGMVWYGMYVCKYVMYVVMQVM